MIMVFIKPSNIFAYLNTNCPAGFEDGNKDGIFDEKFLKAGGSCPLTVEYTYFLRPGNKLESYDYVGSSKFDSNKECCKDFGVSENGTSHIIILLPKLKSGEDPNAWKKPGYSCPINYSSDPDKCNVGTDLTTQCCRLYKRSNETIYLKADPNPIVGHANKVLTSSLNNKDAMCCKPGGYENNYQSMGTQTINFYDSNCGIRYHDPNWFVSDSFDIQPKIACTYTAAESSLSTIKCCPMGDENGNWSDTETACQDNGSTLKDYCCRKTSTGSEKKDKVSCSDPNAKKPFIDPKKYLKPDSSGQIPINTNPEPVSGKNGDSTLTMKLSENKGMVFCSSSDTPQSKPEPGNLRVYTALGCVPATVETFIKWLLPYLFGIAGGISFLLMVFGFIKVATSAGDPKEIEGAKETITSALIGLLVSIFALFILKLILADILKIPGIS